MNLKTSIIISFLISLAFITFLVLRAGDDNKQADNYLPPASGAIRHELAQDNKKQNTPAPASRGTVEEKPVNSQTFPGLDEDSLFVRELKSKPAAKAYLEYGYVSPEVLQAKGTVKGRSKLRRPDGRKVDALIVDYKGQLYDAEVGFPCYLCADSLAKLGLKLPYF